MTATTTNATTLDAALHEWATANGWLPYDDAWMDRDGETFAPGVAARQAIVCDLQDHAPGVFGDLVEAYGDDVWRAIDGVPIDAE